MVKTQSLQKCTFYKQKGFSAETEKPTRKLGYQLTESQLENLGIGKNVRLNPPKNLKLEDKERIDEFLKYHREQIFKVK